MDESNTTRAPRKVKDLGPLHELLKRGLPEFVDDDGVLDVAAVAERMGISKTAVYYFFSRKSISKKRIAMVLELSKKTKPRKRPATMIVNGKQVPWSALTLDDFWPFMN